MMLDATQRYEQPLTSERLFAWQSASFPAGRSGMRRITVGGWRQDTTGPMQVVSGPMGRERVHFEAPPAAVIDREMRSFLNWFTHRRRRRPCDQGGDCAFLVRLRYTPLRMGTGASPGQLRIWRWPGRMATGQRFYSVSSQIRGERQDYYRILERTQKGTTDVTPWLVWFLNCLSAAINSADDTLAHIVAKGNFWTRISHLPCNERQITMLNRLLDGFEGNLTSAKWAQITKCSHDTALRDINELISYGVLLRSQARGRSTSYDLIALQSDS